MKPRGNCILTVALVVFSLQAVAQETFERTVMRDSASVEVDTVRRRPLRKLFRLFSSSEVRGHQKGIRGKDSVALSFEGKKLKHDFKIPFQGDSVGGQKGLAAHGNPKELRKISKKEMNALLKQHISRDSLLSLWKRMEDSTRFKSRKQEEEFNELIAERGEQLPNKDLPVNEQEARKELETVVEGQRKQLENAEIDKSALGLDLQKNKNKRKKIEKVERRIDQGTNAVEGARELSKAKDLESFTKQYESNAEKHHWPNPENYKNSFLSDFNQLSDSAKSEYARLRAKQLEFEEQRPPVVTVENLTAEMKSRLDSLKPKFLMKSKVLSKSDSIREVVYSKRKIFKVGDYRELIVGLADDTPGNFSLSPSLGFELGKNFSLGTGLLLDIHAQKDFALKLGYKAFVRYDFIDNYFLQVENVHYFKGISNPTPAEEGEQVEGHSSMLAIGAGGVYSITKKFGVTFQALYQIVESRHSFNKSPFVFRAGVNF